MVPSILGLLRIKRMCTSPVVPSTKVTRSRESGKAATDVTRQGNGVPYRRFYFRGSIAFGGFSWLHRFQFSISSSRCSAAHSNTNVTARPGNEPRMTRKSHRSPNRCAGFLMDRGQLSQTTLSKLRGLRPYHQIHVALQELKQRHELIERLFVIGLIQQPI